MRLEWRSLRITLTPGTGFWCKRGFCLLLALISSVAGSLRSPALSSTPSCWSPLFCLRPSGVFVLLQCSGDNHAGQPALHPAAALHRRRALLAPHLRGHHCYWLRWEPAPPPPPHNPLNNLAMAAKGDRFDGVASVLQVSGTVSGSTGAWVGSLVLMSPSPTSASTQTSASTCSSARHGSSSVRGHFNTYCLCSTAIFIHADSFLPVCFAVIALSVAEAVILVVLIFLRTRLRIAIALLKEGSKSVPVIWLIICVLELNNLWSLLFSGPSATSCPLSSTPSSPLFFWPSASLIGPSQPCILQSAFWR